MSETQDLRAERRLRQAADLLVEQLREALGVPEGESIVAAARTLRKRFDRLADIEETRAACCVANEAEAARLRAENARWVARVKVLEARLAQVRAAADGKVG